MDCITIHFLVFVFPLNREPIRNYDGLQARDQGSQAAGSGSVVLQGNQGSRSRTEKQMSQNAEMPFTTGKGCNRIFAVNGKRPEMRGKVSQDFVYDCSFQTSFLNWQVARPIQIDEIYHSRDTGLILTSFSNKWAVRPISFDVT